MNVIMVRSRVCDSRGDIEIGWVATHSLNLGRNAGRREQV